MTDTPKTYRCTVCDSDLVPILNDGVQHWMTTAKSGCFSKLLEQEDIDALIKVQIVELKLP